MVSIALREKVHTAILGFALVGLSALGIQTYVRGFTDGASPESVRTGSDASSPLSAVQPPSSLQLASTQPQSGPPAPTIAMGRLNLNLLGILWFLLVVAVMAAPLGRQVDQPARARFRLYTFLLSVVPLAAAIAVVIFVLRHRYSELTLLQWVAVGAVVAIFGFTSRSAFAPVPRLSAREVRADISLGSRHPVTWGCVLAVVTVLTIGPSPLMATGQSLDEDEIVSWFDALPRVPLPDTLSAKPVTIVKVIDYQCPPCRRMEEYYGQALPELVGLYAGLVSVQTLNYPLDAECNRYVDRTPHPGACEAAASMQLAIEHGTAEPMARWLWLNQQALSRSSVFAAARSVGGIADIDDQYDRALRRVRADIDLAHALGARRTPTVLVNGASVGVVPKKVLGRIILYELQRLGHPARQLGEAQ